MVAFFQLIATFFKGLITVPRALLNTLFQWKMFKYYSQSGLKEIKGEIKPVSGFKRFFLNLGVIAVIVLIIAAIIGLLVFLAYLNRSLELERFLGGPWPWLRKVWLPVVFVLFVLVCFQAYWLWRLLGPERETAEYPAIDAAWSEAKLALEQAGISLTESPIYLVLGQPAGGIDAVFRASQLVFPVRQVPRQGDAPLHVYAGATGIFVAAKGNSLLGGQAEYLVREVSASVDPQKSSALNGSLFEEEPEQPAQSASEQPQGESDLLLGGENLLDPVSPTDGGSEVALGELGPSTLLAEEPDPLVAPRRRRPSLFGKTEEMQQLTAQLKYLCQRMVRDRRPYCPINGILLLVPFAATEDDEESSQTATLCQQDIAAARAVFRTESPIFTLVCDMETAPGFPQLIEQLPPARRQRFLGQAFPLKPDLKPQDVPAMVESGVEWICEALSVLVSRFFRVEIPGQEARADVAQMNYRLYQLVSALEERQPRLGNLMARIAVQETGRPLPFGGCYLGATGLDAAREQAFVGEVFRQMHASQNSVSWTPEAAAEDAGYHRLAWQGYLALTAFVVVVSFLIYWRWRTG